jgi:hypothetical protein
MNLVEIDMSEVACALTGQPAVHHGTIDLTADTTLHRFDSDTLHILVDAGGAYRAVQSPSTAREKVIKEGHLSEFSRHA